MTPKKPKNNNIVYFAHPIDSYNSEYEKDCIALINKTIKPIEIINPNSQEFKKKLAIVNKKFGGQRNIEAIRNRDVFFPQINKCDIFVYVPTIKNKFTNGIDTELKYALSRTKTIRGKNIYKISYENKNLEIMKMNQKNISNNINDIKLMNNMWVLKTVSDYVQYFNNNPELKPFMISQLKCIDVDNEKLRQAVIPHYNSVYATNDFKERNNNFRCKKHNIEHSFVDPTKQLKTLKCPYTDFSKWIPGYSGFNLDNIEQINFDILMKSSRVIHKSMYLFPESVFVRRQGVYWRDENGHPIKEKDGWEKDWYKFKGTELIYDLDVAPDAKDQNLSFFDESVFSDFNKGIELTREHIRQDWEIDDYKLGFSGNGIYFILPEMAFDENNYDYYSMCYEFSESRLNLLKKFKKNNITNVIPDQKTEWNKYFKVLGTFHGKLERISIPLNKDEPLDIKWMDDITNIRTGLEGNVFNEILKRANWR